MISDGKARRIATDWASPADPAMAALSTSGAILDSILHEIELNTIRFARTQTDREELTALAVYCSMDGLRGPVPGWANVWED